MTGLLTGSDAIAEEYADRVIVTENRGLSSARNTGVEAASAKKVSGFSPCQVPIARRINKLIGI